MMTPEQYKHAMRDLGFDARFKDGKPLSEWLQALGISNPTHNRYLIKGPSDTAARLITALLRIQHLEQQLSESAPKHP